MSKKYVHKDGRVYRVFETPFTDWDKVPSTDFPSTLICENDDQLRAQVGDCIIIDRPKPASNTAPKPSGLPLEAIIGALAVMDIPQAAKDILLARRSDQEGQAVTVTNLPQSDKVGNLRAEVAYQDKMLQEFRLVLASIGNAYSKEEAEAIGNFIIAVDPSLESELVKAKISQTSRRFTL